jgi:hypothetical protein
VRLFIFAQNTFHLCWSKKNFLSLLLATDFLSLLLTKRLFAFLATDFSAFAHFFEIYTQKVKILARES